MKLLAAALAAITLLAISASAVENSPSDVHAIVARAQQRVEATDLRATGRLVRVDAGGKRTSYPFTLKAHWFPGVLRVLGEINAEGTARVHILLEMRANGQTSIQVAHPGDKSPVVLSPDKWSDGPLGTGFSYEDLLEPQYFWPGQTLVRQVKYGARDCNLLKSIPGPADRTHYTEVQTWLDQSISYPVYVEKTTRTGAVKEFTYFGLRQNEGVWSASQVEAKIRGQSGSTLLIIERGSPKANLALKDFSPEQFIRF